MKLLFSLVLLANLPTNSVAKFASDVDYNEDVLDKYGDYSYKEFKAIWKDLDSRIKYQLEEHYRILKREHFNSGRGKRRKKDARFRFEARNAANPWSLSDTCPDQHDGFTDFHEYFADTLAAQGDNSWIAIDRPILLTKSVTVGEIRIKSKGNKIGKLVFKDNGPDGEKIHLRAKNIKVWQDGELWIGSKNPNCRYKGNADISLYGSRDAHDRNGIVGYKWLWAAGNGTVEIHGKEKKSWTWLDGDHLYSKNTPTDNLHFVQSKKTWPMIGNQLVFHVLSAEGDIKEMFAIPSEHTPMPGDEGHFNAEIKYKSEEEADEYLNSLNNEEVVLFFTDFHFPLNQQIRSTLEPFIGNASAWDELFADEVNQRYSQIAGLFRVDLGDSESFFTHKIPETTEDGTRLATKGIGYSEAVEGVSYKYKDPPYVLGPISLGGEKSGDQFSVEIQHVWDWDSNISKDATFSVETFAKKMASNVSNANFWNWQLNRPNSFGEWNKALKNRVYLSVRYTGPNEGGKPILTLADDVSSWEVGDKIVVAATNFDPRESETFLIVDCEGKCAENQVKVDRTPTFTHWGRIDSRTGLDQRAEVGLLSRNVRFYGELEDTGCDYAFTREQLSMDSPNHVCEDSPSQCTNHQICSECHKQCLDTELTSFASYDDCILTASSKCDVDNDEECHTDDQCGCSENCDACGDKCESDCCKCKADCTSANECPNIPNPEEFKIEGETPIKWGCEYYKNMTGEDKDMHGAHMIFTRGFRNVHVSHMEIFNAGQPRLARYPVHWHHAYYVGEKGKYDDPSSATHLSIHDSFSRFVTVHGTHEAVVTDNVGYNTHGHGFFLEDGYEQENYLRRNLGIMVKPGIILPSERHESICFKANDGYAGEGSKVGDVGDNDGKGWNALTCRGLSVFWISNPHNYIDYNAAVGGDVGFWSFSHTANKKYGFYSIPRDPEMMKENPLEARRQWMGNKASGCAASGFIQDNSVKDLHSEVTKETPEPRFAIVGTPIKVMYKSLNDPEDSIMCAVPFGAADSEFGTDALYAEFPECQEIVEDNNGHSGDSGIINDPRPNLWSKPMGNWAIQHMDDWKIHHTSEMNWVRNEDVRHDGWQYSDNARGWIIKSTTPSAGIRKTFNNALFVGMSKNTGHRRCGNDKFMETTTMNLANVVACPFKAGEKAIVKPFNMNNYCPGWNQSPYDPPSNMPDGFHTNPDALPEGTLTNNCPVVAASCNDKPNLFWFKPEGDVFRMFGKEITYPVQGLAMYDTWMPTMMENNVFYDYPGLDAYRHAIGSHLSNEFQMSIKNLYLRNNKFYNVDRAIQMAVIDSNEYTLIDGVATSGDAGTIYEYYGSDFAVKPSMPIRRALGDGEKTTGFVDMDGTWSPNGEPSFIITEECHTIATGCTKNITGNGILDPAWMSCPLDLDMAVMSIAVGGAGYPTSETEGVQLHITSAIDRDRTLIMNSNKDIYSGEYRPNLEAYHPYMLHWKGTPPQSRIMFDVSEAEIGTWYRMSACVGETAIVNSITSERKYVSNQVKDFSTNSKAGSAMPIPTPIYEANSLLEMATINDKSSYWHDQESGWIHLKLYEHGDRTKGGEFTEHYNDCNMVESCVNSECSEEEVCTIITTGPNIIDDNPNFLGRKFGSAYRYNYIEGQSMILVNLDASTIPLDQGDIICPYFEEPTPVTCDDGFVVDTSTNSCENVNECENGTPCGANAECNDNDGSFVCECHLGWNTGASDAEPCEDVDECLLGSCAAPADCNNFDGGFTCSCPAGYTLNDDSLGCNDNNECDNGDHNCDANAGCTNIDGSFECACNGGFSGSGTECEDDNECDNPDACPANAACTNFDGGFECTCKDGFGRSLTCDNLNECNLGTHNCHANAICTDTTGSFECNCLTGFEGSGQSCKDVNECDDPDFCGANADCTNLTGGFSCTCKDGFGDNAAGECVDIKECETGDHTCDDNASCTDTEGSFECECNSGWDGDGHTCDDVDECLIDVPVQCPDTAICTDFDGGFSCECKSGFTTDDTTSPITCNDIDECTDGTHTCDPDNGICNNNDGSFECSCQDGWAAIGGIADTLCSNIDECLHPNFHNCDINAKCDDNDGSFTCTCLDGFTGDGTDGNCVEDSVELVDECALGTHDCDLTTTICEDTDAGYLCNCKDRYLATDSANTCVFDIDSCDSKADLGVAWKGVNKCKPTANNAMFVDEGDALAIKCNIPGTAETAAYTGFNIFTKKYCGSDFIAGIADGRIRFEYADKASQYETSTNAYLRDDKDIPARSSATTQWTSPANSVTSNTGNTKKDIAWLIIKGLKNVDMGSKSLSDCLVKTQVGIIPGEIKTQDETGCVGNQKNVNWRTEEAIRRSEGL